MGKILLKDIFFSPQIQSEWSDITLWDKLLSHTIMKNPKSV